MSHSIRLVSAVAILLTMRFPVVAADPPAGARTLRVVVLDPQDKPLDGANVHSSIWTEEKDFKSNHDYKTDADGAAHVKLPKTFYILRLWASKKPFVTMFANWEKNELASGKEFPAEYSMRLEAGVTAGGRVVDEAGKPIGGVNVQVSMSGDPKPTRSDGRTRYDTWLAYGTDAVTTDAKGRWQIDNVPNHPKVELSLLVAHPDFVADEQWGQLQKANGVTTAMIRDMTATLTLKPGVIVRGRVTGPDGKPIKDAIVVVGDRPYDSSTAKKFPTDAEGNYRLPPFAPGETTFTVIAGEGAPQLRKIALRPDLPPQDFRLEPGKPVRLRVVDAAGKPVSKASVDITGWKGSESLQTIHNPNHPKIPDTRIPRQTDGDGLWEWRSAPDDAVKLRVWSKGMTSADLEVAGGGPDRTITLKSEHRITGRVTDAVTGKPIP